MATEENIRELRFRLEDGSIKCSERCLYQSAKWAAEMLDSLVAIDGDTDIDSPMDLAESTAQLTNPFLRQQDALEAALEAQEAHKYLLAKSYFDTREYDRCAAVFLPPTISPVPLFSISPNPRSRSSLTPQSKSKRPLGTTGSKDHDGPSKNLYPRLSQKSLFLALYAKYLAGEKRREEETEMVLGPADGGMTVNRELPDLARGLEAWFKERQEQGLDDRGQGWLEYLYAVVLLKGKNEEEAKKWLVRSVHLYPFHWGAWQELNELLSNLEDLKRMEEALPQNIMTLMFHLYSSQELYQATEDTHNTLSDLEAIFPSSAFLKTQRALLYYHSKDFEEASSIFADILISSPYRLDSLDHYSNILYVMGCRPQLAFIAQLATATDKFRPETCCVVGNYYSLKSEHEKAVMYFRRALTLDRNFLSAWTLMGHEYIEMKNTHAAIESYRRAVDVNRKDYRAWYGLGQAYEVLDMSFYALYYYQRAAALRPYDPKMWQAVGTCYMKMGLLQQSIQALKRALVAGAYYEPASFSDSGVSNNNASIGLNSSQSGNPPGSQSVAAGRKILDPETLYQIATLYERLGEDEEACAYMELTLRQETGEVPCRNGSVDNVSTSEEEQTEEERNDNDNDSDHDQKIHERKRKSKTDTDSSAGGRGRKTHPRQSYRDADGADMDTEETDHVGGTGVTATTSKARLWLARWALRQGDLTRADQLAGELCQDGVEVEEAKALIRDVRAQREDE